MLCLGTLQALLAGAPTVAVAVPPARVTDAPNIVFVMLDDMRTDELRFMPSTRRLLAKQGVRFQNSFAPFPLCCPARSSVFTGLYAHNHGVYDVEPPYGFNAFDDSSTIATWLQNAGYWTGYLGKYLNGYGEMPVPGQDTGSSLLYLPPGWTQWRGSIDGGIEKGQPDFGSTYFYKNVTLSRNGVDLDNYRGQYQTELYGDLATRTLRTRAKSDQPFFFYLSFVAPHNGAPHEKDDPTVVPQAGSSTRFGSPARPGWVRGRFDTVLKKAPGAGWNDPDMGDKPAYMQAPAISKAEWGAIRTVARQRAEALYLVDLQVKRLIETLQSSGVLDDTLIVFTSDNGFFLGEQRRRQGKILPYEPSIRVPLLMRGPGIPHGVTRSDPFTSIDYAPTLAEAAGLALPGPVDGESLLDVARHGDQGWTRAILTETGPLDEVPGRETDTAGNALQPDEAADPRSIIGIRTSQYLYTDWATGEEELYDLSKDPQEYDNLVEDPDYTDTLTELRQVLHDMRACAGDACRAQLPADLR